MIRQLACCLFFAFSATSLAAPPAPVLAWPNGPLEARVAFDQPADESVAKEMIGKTITFSGKDADTASQGTLRIAGARLADGGRTMILATDPHPRDATYRLGVGTTTLTYTLHGVEATWTGDDQTTCSVWWPSLDDDQLREFSKSSVEHQRMLSNLARPGQVQFLGILNLPKENYMLKIKTSGTLEATIGDAAGTWGDDGALDLALESTGEPIDLDVTIHTTEGKPFTLAVTSQSEKDAAATPVATRSLLLPWTPISPFVSPSTSPVPDLAGGDPIKGEQVFNGENAKCASCHKINGKGGEVGPDLSNQTDRELAAIYRDINEPSAVIHPDYVQYIVATKDGRVASGIVRAEGPDAIKVTDANAKTTIIPRSEIEDFRPGSASLMPVGLAGAIGEAKMRDLVTYLKSGGKKHTIANDAEKP